MENKKSACYFKSTDVFRIDYDFNRKVSKSSLSLFKRMQYNIAKLDSHTHTRLYLFYVWKIRVSFGIKSKNIINEAALLGTYLNLKEFV